jgi:hypothetical protein
MPTKDNYFIVLDEAPIKKHPTPKYTLHFGNINTAVGVNVRDRHNNDAESRTITALLYLVPKTDKVYRVYLWRTDGKTGYKLIGYGKGR